MPIFDICFNLCFELKFVCFACNLFFLFHWVTLLVLIMLGINPLAHDMYPIYMLYYLESSFNIPSQCGSYWLKWGCKCGRSSIKR